MSGDQVSNQTLTRPTSRPLKARLTRQYVIRALHNLLNPDLNDAENERLYGICYRLHGHDYHILVTFEAEIDPVSGLCIDRDRVDRVVNKELVERFDGTNLNEHMPSTSCESLVCLLFDLLKPHFKPGELVDVSIQETRKNWFGRDLSLAARDQGS